MKAFLIKTIYFIIILFLIIGLITLFFYKKSDFLFASNSLSYNVKEEFIINHKDEMINCNFFVIGSSMSLNNLDCVLLSKKADQKVLNLSSWGMKFSNFSNFNIWDKKNIILTNINFTDFGDAELLIYPSNSYRFFNIAKNLGTFISHIQDKETYLKFEKNDHYTSLNFDSSGSIIYSESKFFKIDSVRWNLRERKLSEIDINNFLTEIKIQAPRVKQIIISFSPVRRQLYNLGQSATIKKLENNLNLIPNVYFINNYDRYYC